MSWHSAGKSEAQDSVCRAVRQVITPRAHDVGGVSVKRALPTRHCRSIGPFVFLDEMGPARFAPGDGINVQQHPHIGLGTITYLLRGELLHKDSLGTEQVICPGEVNWMNAGGGIVHSETTRDEVQASGQILHGLQTWLALPQADEQMQPEFQHIPAQALPLIENDGCTVRVLAGEIHDRSSPARMRSATLYADIQLAADAAFAVPDHVPELGIYLISGRVDIAGTLFSGSQLLVLAPGSDCNIVAAEPVRMVLIGGEPLDGRRHMWWNFVSSRRERIEQAKSDWRNGRFTLADPDAPIIPLPGETGA